MDLQTLIKQSNLSEAEIRKVLHSTPKPKIKYHHDFGKRKIRLGIASDFHIGSLCFDYKSFDCSVKRFDAEGIDLILCAGDVLEGMSNREGHIYELNRIGYSAQLKEAVELLSQYRQPFHFITGNHDEWAKKKANGGLIIGEEIERRVKNSKFLGEMEARIDLGNAFLDLTHRGQTAYALSYPGQKMINGLEGGTKPAILINGNLHKAIYMFYRNIHFIEAATFQRQTEFMKMKGSPAHVGFWILDIELGRGIQSFRPTFYPQY